jgi:threonine synthase
VVYYFAAALQLGAPQRKVAFAVPTGNFGDVFAGYVAAQMGLPIERLIVATNINDILHRALSTGDYSAGSVTPTAAPSMDIQVSSNFERLLFDAAGRDGALIAQQMKTFDATKVLHLTNAQRAAAAGLFTSARADADQMIAAQRWAYEACGEVIDPHTAIGLHAARAAQGLPADVPVVTLATAHPAKFGDAVESAIGVRPALPARVGDLFDREERYDRLAGTYDAVKDYVTARATPRHG